MSNTKQIADPFDKFCANSGYSGDYFVVPKSFLNEGVDLTPSEWYLMMELFSAYRKHDNRVKNVNFTAIATNTKTNRSFVSQVFSKLERRGFLVRNGRTVDVSGSWKDGTEEFRKIPSIFLRKFDELGFQAPNHLRCFLVVYNLSFYDKIFINLDTIAEKAECSYNTAKKWIENESSHLLEAVVENPYDPTTLSLQPVYSTVKKLLTVDGEITSTESDEPLSSSVRYFTNKFGCSYEQLKQSRTFQNLCRLDSRITDTLAKIPKEELEGYGNLYLLENKVNPLQFEETYRLYIGVAKKYVNHCLDSGITPKDFVGEAKFLAAHHDNVRLDKFRARITSATGFDKWDIPFEETLIS